MKLIYHLPHISYDFTNSKFVDFEYNEALQYLKLLYKNISIFQDQFLSKFEFIPNLDKLCIKLGNEFDDAIPLNEMQINNIKNKDCKQFAQYHFENYNLEKAENKSDFLKKFTQKIKAFLDEGKPDENDLYLINFPASLSELVNKKQHFTINSIPEYEIKQKEEYVEFTVKNVTKLIINDSIKYLVCSNCEIKEIELTFNLQLLEADNNTISKIELSDNLIEVSLLNNPLEYVSINKNLKTLTISHPNNQNIILDNSIENENLEVNYYIN